MNCMCDDYDNTELILLHFRAFKIQVFSFRELGIDWYGAAKWNLHVRHPSHPTNWDFGFLYRCFSLAGNFRRTENKLSLTPFILKFSRIDHDLTLGSFQKYLQILSPFSTVFSQSKITPPGFWLSWMLHPI